MEPTVVKFGGNIGVLVGEALDARARQIERATGQPYLECFRQAQREMPEEAEAYYPPAPAHVYSFDSSRNGEDFPLIRANPLGDEVDRWMQTQGVEPEKLSLMEYRAWLEKFRKAHPNSGYEKPVTHDWR